MNYQPTIRHKTYSIHLISYRRKIGWIPKATVKAPEGDTKGHTVAGKSEGSFYPPKRPRTPWQRNQPSMGLIRSFPQRPID